ncbi:hypothetical protein NDU88_001847 [Pleurodeles waltl]|uniref:Uncharacterized protein n=1 Tax=Pleurodeles waltl TaxID=8319 RepID=A0AAV7U812_PLEWA|nr:hypothetical protein NDU88_001847 [Pleurodeles waltl]
MDICLSYLSAPLQNTQATAVPAPRDELTRPVLLTRQLPDLKAGLQMQHAPLSVCLSPLLRENRSPRDLGTGNYELKEYTARALFKSQVLAYAEHAAFSSLFLKRTSRISTARTRGSRDYNNNIIRIEKKASQL